MDIKDPAIIKKTWSKPEVTFIKKNKVEGRSSSSFSKDPSSNQEHPLQDDDSSPSPS